MKILITGGCGHIGSYLANELAKVNHIKEINIVDNFQRENFGLLFFQNKKIKFFFNDVSSKKFLSQFEKKRFDWIIHLAALTNAEASLNNKKATERNNYNCTTNVVSLANKINSKLIFISSTSVYGSSNLKDISEDDFDEINPQSPYALTKIKEENFIIKHCKRYLILRFGTIVGPSIGMRFHTAVNKFCLQAYLDLPITVWRTALNQKRPYLSLIDASNFIIFTINTKILNNQVLNVLSANLTVKNILDIIRIKYPNLSIEFVTSKIMNQLSYDISNYKLKKIGFTPKKNNLKKSILSTLNFLNGTKSKDLKINYKIK